MTLKLKYAHVAKDRSNMKHILSSVLGLESKTIIIKYSTCELIRDYNNMG